MIVTSRRAFLRSACAASMFGGASLTNALNAFSASAATTTGYRALVCVFLRGGMDCHDTLLPMDAASRSDLEEVRPSTFAGRADRAAGALLELDPVNQSAFGDRRFALPPEMAPLHALFQNGSAAIVANVGPLLRPIDRETYQSDRSSRPSKLFSHNDQQSTWSAFRGEGARVGWGGRFADAALESNANDTPIFTAISTSGTDVFLSGEIARQYELSSNGPPQIAELQTPRLLGSGRDSDAALAALDAHFRYSGGTPSNLFQSDVVDVNRRALDANATFNSAREGADSLDDAFPDTRLGGQLRAVAETIAIRNALGASRQVFLVSIGGFDTHSGQANSLPNRHNEIATGLAAFHQSMADMNIADQVTAFTVSDFGRTLAENGDGTDHGWGGHHFVVGGGVAGQRIYGDPPPYRFDHDRDAGQGRLIPETSVEQYAASLGSWFGLSQAELERALPNLRSFQTPPAFI